MKKEELEIEIKKLEEGHKLHKVNDTVMFNLQYEANKLFYTILIEFNEKMEEYNKKLLFFTIVIAILTLVMAIPILKPIFFCMAKKPL